MNSRGFVVMLALLAAPAAAHADGDATLGQKVFLKCRACHQIGENAKNAVGPELNGLFGRHSGSVEGYKYSDANKNSGIVWDETVFREYIHDPKAKVPGTKMTFVGLKDDKDIDNVIAYIKQFGPDGKKQ
ncbi:cytochrome c family protein [Kaistia sp. 32K]|uniref:c-type cytochrome n=1 Tax=Kaistia sp. 32K TaxID=2795690 RepID=UPI001915853D|nr:cytochrome c family protein [Kaistia sp. 32K]